jgi:hypothetical protein
MKFNNLESVDMELTQGINMLPRRWNQEFHSIRGEIQSYFLDRQII